MILTINDIRKTFRGEKDIVKAVDGVSFSAAGGSPMGLLGRNGAGKTTCIRMIMNIIHPDSGELLLDGKPLYSSKVKLGYLPEERGLYRKDKVHEQMVYFGRLRGMSKSDAQRESSDWLERLELADRRNETLESLSKGNQQKVQLAIALLNNPDILILDEPFSGLDPVNAAQLKAIVRQHADRGAIVIFSSHQMGAVEDFCDSMVMLNKGQVVLGGRIGDIRRSYPREKLRVVAESREGEGNPYESRAFLSATDGVGEVEFSRGEALIHLKNPDNAKKIMCKLLYSGLFISALEIAPPSLEEIFVEKAGSSSADNEEQKDGYSEGGAAE
jgi:ABC-2 type transport system ATP-binding protein